MSSLQTTAKLVTRSFAGKSIGVASPVESHTHAPVALSTNSFASPQQTPAGIPRSLEASYSSVLANTESAEESQVQYHGVKRKSTSTDLSTPKPNDVVIRIQRLKKKLTPETYGEEEFFHDFCLPGDMLVENIGKEIINEIPGTSIPI